MTLLKVGDYVMNTENISHVNLEAHLSDNESGVIVYMNSVEGTINERYKEFSRETIAFSGRDAEALRGYLSDPKNVSIVS